LRVIRCPTLQVSQFLFPGQRSDTFLTDHVYIYIHTHMPISVAARSKAWVCGRSLAGIVGSNPAGGIDVCVECWVLCVVRYRALRRADHSSRGVLLTVKCRCVWSRNLKNEEAMARGRPQRHSENIYRGCQKMYTHVAQAAVRRNQKCLDADGNHFEHLL